MSVYDKISKPIGRLNWQCNIFHDDGNIESDGGGKSCMYLAPPGKGKSTLMIQAAQQIRSVLGDSKKSYIAHINQGKDTSHFEVVPETVVWRIREFDNFGSAIPANWIHSNPYWSVTVKPLHVFVHERDNPVFYSIQKGEHVTPTNMVPIERYRDANDLMKKLHWNCINCVLEPQTYRLSENLIFSLKKHKMEDDPNAQPPQNPSQEPEIDPATGNPVRRKPKEPKKKKGVDYANKFVDPAYFWYDLLDITYRSNNRRHVTFFIDEFHDVAEADCEGDAWKLVSILATKTYPQFRKNNVSLHLSTHQMGFVDYRIARRIEYINWFRGARIAPNHSMISLQPLLSNLEIGQLITEEANIQFGIMTFDKIHNAPPQVYVEGLLGANKALNEAEFNKLLEAQEALTPPDYFKMKPRTVLPDVIEI